MDVGVERVFLCQKYHNANIHYIRDEDIKAVNRLKENTESSFISTGDQAYIIYLYEEDNIGQYSGSIDPTEAINAEYDDEGGIQ